MMLKLSTEEMLAQWRLRRDLEPLRQDCTVERFDGLDLTPLLIAQMRSWYLNLLDTAPPEFLAPVDIASEVALSLNHEQASASIALPERCRRVVEVKLSTWQRPAEIAEPQSPRALLQNNPFTRSRTVFPVAVKQDKVLSLYGIEPGSTPSIERLLCIVEPDDGFYTLDERALSLIVPEVL